MVFQEKVPENNLCITGGSGFVGRKLIAKSLLDGYNVINIARANIEQYFPCGKVEIISDASDQKIKALFAHTRFVAVVHLATSYFCDVFTWKDFQYVNFTLPMTLASLCENARFINAGTYWEFSSKNDGPNGNYALSKRYFREFYSEAITNIYAVNLMLYGTYGDGDSRGKVHDQIINAANAGKAIRLSEGFQKLNLVDIEDVVSAFRAAIRGELAPGTYGLFAQNEYSLRDIVEVVSRYKKLHVEWGAIGYRGNEIMKPAYPYSLPANWQCRGSFEKYISSAIAIK